MRRSVSPSVGTSWIGSMRRAIQAGHISRAVELIVFDTVNISNWPYYWDWQNSPYQYHGEFGTMNHPGSIDNPGIFFGMGQRIITIKKKDTLIIHEASDITEFAKTLNKKETEADFMGLIFVRSDKKNDTIIAKLNWTGFGLIKTQKQSKIKNNKVLPECLMNGEKMNVPHHAAIMTIRKNQPVWDPR